LTSIQVDWPQAWVKTGIMNDFRAQIIPNTCQELLIEVERRQFPVLKARFPKA
jgi:hypothetical protein